MPKRLPEWFSALDLKEALLVWLGSAQQRWESAAITRFGDRYSAKAVRLALRELQHQQHIMLMGSDRVTWSLQVSGRNVARRARERAQKKLAQRKAKAAA